MRSQARCSAGHWGVLRSCGEAMGGGGLGSWQADGGSGLDMSGWGEMLEPAGTLER